MQSPSSRSRHLASAVAALAFFASLSSWANLPPLISREILFGNPEKTAPQMSPDGKKLSWLAPDKKNVLQVWVQTIGQKDEKSVTNDKKRGIRQYLWAKNSKEVLYLQDTDGDENWHIYGVDLESGNVRDLTPFQGVRAQVSATDYKFPNEILVSLNLRDRRLFDVYRLTLSTGALVLDTENPGDVSDFRADPELQIRAASLTTKDGGTEIRIRDNPKSAWKTWLKVGPEEILRFGDFTGDGKSVTIISSIGSDTARAVEKNLATGKEKVLASSPEADVSRAMTNPKTHVVEAIGFDAGRLTWTVVDPSIKGDFDAIGKLSEGVFTVPSRDLADATWLVAFNTDRGSPRYYSYDRAAKKGTFLFASQPKLEGLALSEMKPVAIKARDGLTLNGYLTLPSGVPAKGLPMVLYVHGGPWARDFWGYNPTAQWFANRGYSSLQVNYRGSVGYGKKFLSAGDRQWGLKMHDDLIDAVDWAIKQGIADPKKVAIYGGSYGGYAALAGVTFTPEKFACAVDIVGPSNLKTLIASIPPYWKTERALFDVRMGNVDDPKDADLIRAASPLFKADKIVRPLLIGQGANDPRVNQAESEQIVAAIEKRGGKVTYVLYPDEGHGFARPENRIDFNARAEAFLAKYLGGRAEPLAGDKYPGSTAVVRVIGEQTVSTVRPENPTR
jgi:dipeptidyl aminopeptidase/acylaminoacyl peptidase